MMRPYWPLIACAGAGWSLFRWFVEGLQREPVHLVPLGAALLLLLRNKPQPDATPSTASILIMLAFAWSSPFMPPVLAALLWVTTFVLVASPSHFQRPLHPGFGALLVLCLPALSALQLIVGYPLRVVCASISALLLSVGGLFAERLGASLQVNGVMYQVDAPCSGISMWWTSLVVVAWICARSGCSVLGTLKRAALATLIVVLGNSVRAATLVQISISPIPLSDGLHEAVGVTVFASCLLAIVACIKEREGSEPCSVS